MKPIKDEDLPANTKIGMEIVCKEDSFAYYGPDSSSQVYAKYYSLKEGCNIMTFEKNLGFVDMTIAFPKNSPFRLIIDHE